MLHSMSISLSLLSLLQADQGIYHEKVQSMISKNTCRLIININDLRRKYPKRAAR